MIYYKCPTCRTILANKDLPYKERLNAICANNKLSTKEKDAAKKKLLTDLELHRECCRMRIMGDVNLINKIK